MEEQPKTLRGLFTEAEAKRQEIESSWNSNSAAFQENLSAAIATYEECLKVADQVSLFSPNETLDDISSGDLQYVLRQRKSFDRECLTPHRYMPISYYLAELILKIIGGDRKSYLQRARASYERFLRLLDSHDILSKADARLLEKYLDSRDSFSTASATDAAARRETKISRFKGEKELKRKLEVCDFLFVTPSALRPVSPVSQAKSRCIRE